jgi:hypothetical protein
MHFVYNSNKIVYNNNSLSASLVFTNAHILDKRASLNDHTL